MSNTYNIYRMKSNQLKYLYEKIQTIGLREQKTNLSDEYKMTFFFSEKLEGNPVWWWSTYREFFNEGISEPVNLLNFALLIAQNNMYPEYTYLVSLGKSHFYLSKYIEKDFGIQVAIRIANEGSTLLKKSRYFNRGKRQEISSYEKFIPNSYLSGESVEHLKIKALDSVVWGKKSIIFADSIQMETERNPSELSIIFNQIEAALHDAQIINLPKLETVNDNELKAQLNDLLLKKLAKGDGNISIEEFDVFGVNFCFKFINYKYRIFFTSDDGKRKHSKEIGNTLEIADVYNFIADLENFQDLDLIKIQFKLEEKGSFTKTLKEVLDFYIRKDDITYFLKNGDWCSFNQVFLEYLKKSLESIPVEIREPLIEAEFQKWKSDKESKIAQGIAVENKITYREYYFNKKQETEFGYELMDRELELIKSIESGQKKYKLEVADLYKEKELIAVKISDDEKELIYNIEQSKDSISLIMERTVKTDKEIKIASLWFIFKEEISRITQFNSIQFLLAIDNWQFLIKKYELEAKIYISHHKGI